MAQPSTARPPKAPTGVAMGAPKETHVPGLTAWPPPSLCRRKSPCWPAARPCRHCTSTGCRVCSGAAARVPAEAWAAEQAAARAAKAAASRGLWKGPVSVAARAPAPLPAGAPAPPRAHNVARDYAAAMRAVGAAPTAAAAAAAMHEAMVGLLASHRFFTAVRFDRACATFVQAAAQFGLGSGAAGAAGAAAAAAPLPAGAELLAETLLEFFELAAGGAGGAGFFGAARLSAADLQRVVATLAAEGAFGALQGVLCSPIAAHAGVARRALGVMAAVVRAGTAGGAEVPAEAEAAFDAAGGLARLGSLARAAAAAGDAPLLEAALQALAGVRVHTGERAQEGAAHCLPLVVALLRGGDARDLPPPPPPAAAQEGAPAAPESPDGVTRAEIVALAAPEAAVEVAVEVGGGACSAAPAAPLGAPTAPTAQTLLLQPPPAPAAPPPLGPLSPRAVAAAVVALARLSEGLMAPPAFRRGVAAAGRFDTAAACAALDAAALSGGRAPALPAHALAPLAALGAALEDVEGGGAGALPLWEAVVVASALQALSRRAALAAWAPWRPYPACLGPRALVAALPAAPGGLAARGAVMRFNPAALRSRLAADGALAAEVAAAAEIAAVPLWLRVLASPFALAYLLYHGAIWAATTGAVLLVGRALMAMEGGGFVARAAGVAAWDWVAAPAGRAVRDWCLRPLARAAAAAARAAHAYIATPAWRAGAAVATHALFPMGRAAAAAARAARAAVVGAATAVWVHALAPAGRAAAWAAGKAAGGAHWATTGVWAHLLAPIGSAVWAHLLAPIGRTASAVGRGAAWAVGQLCKRVLVPAVDALLRALLFFQEKFCFTCYYVLWYPLWYLVLVPLYWAGYYAGKAARFLGALAWQGAEWALVNAALPLWAVARATGAAVWGAVRATGAAVWAVAAPAAALVRGAVGAVARAASAAVRSVVAAVRLLLRGGRR